MFSKPYILINIQSNSATFAVRSPGHGPVLLSCLYLHQKLAPPCPAEHLSHLKLQSKRIRKVSHCSSQRIWKPWFTCLCMSNVLMKIRGRHFTTEESKTRKKKPFPFKHLNDRSRKWILVSVSVVISLITTNNQFVALFSFQGRSTVYMLNKSEKQGKCLFSGGEKWTHDSKRKI